MERSYLILSVFIVASLLFLPVGCENKADVIEEPDVALEAPEPENSPAEAETAPKTAQKGPKITFEKVVKDFGRVNPDSYNKCVFKFKNTGNSLLKIKRVQSTCSCSVPKLKKKEYAPGETGEVEVTYHAGKVARPATRRLYVHSNDKKKPKIQLTIKASVVDKVDYEPKMLNLSLKEENAGCPNITIKSLDRVPFVIMQFKATDGCITAVHDSSVKASEFVLEPKVNMEKLKSTLKGRVEITLNHPGRKKVSIPFEALSNFKTSPSTLTVLNAEPKKKVTREMYVLSSYNEDFEIESTSSKRGIIKVLNSEKIGNRYKLDLEITPPVREGKKRWFSDALYVNIKGGEKMEIGCRGFYSRKKAGTSSK
jgi:hypothetical protein